MVQNKTEKLPDWVLELTRTGEYVIQVGTIFYIFDHSHIYITVETHK